MNVGEELVEVLPDAVLTESKLTVTSIKKATSFVSYVISLLLTI
jgi:hypothetical protein